jgi:signal transduction histidine kinase
VPLPVVWRILRRARSLRFRLAVGLTAVSLLAFTAQTLLLYLEYHNTNTFLREHTLQEDVAILTGGLAWPAVGQGPVLSPSVAERYGTATRRFAILDLGGRLLAASPGVTAPFISLTGSKPQFFELDGDDGGPPFYGLAQRSGTKPHRVLVQIAIRGGASLPFNSLLAEFGSDIAWLWLPFLLLMLVVNLLIVHYGLRPLRRASQYASAIGPDTASIRLPEDRLPREVLPLVQAVNRALDRLEVGYQAQRAFIADTAHELRTPLAVLKAHLGVLPDRAVAQSFSEDVEAMERLINQLLDLARIGVLRISVGDRVDLHEIALDVAMHLAPLAIRQGRSIEVTGAVGPVAIAGSYDFLFRAVRNLVENALSHTPAGTVVTIAVMEHPAALSVADHGPGIPEAEHAAVFERFRQGRAGRNGSGAGLGLAIVAEIAAAHGAAVAIDAGPGGGARFTLRFGEMKP